MRTVLLGSSRTWMVRGPRTRRLEGELQRVVDVKRPGAAIVEVRRRPRPCRSSWAVEDVELSLDDGSILALVWKDLDREGPGSRASTVKPRRLLDPRREPWVYDSVLSRLPGGAPLLGYVSDDEAGLHWLFLEPIQGPPLCEVGDLGVWKAAAAWLGHFHAALMEPSVDAGLLLRQDARLHRWWYRRALALAEGGDAKGAEQLRALGVRHKAAVDQVMDAPTTLLHGEFYPANILVAGSRRRIVPVDWEMAALGPPVLDLAALTSGAWSQEDRVAVTTAYREARLEDGAPCPGLDVLLDRLEAARLLLAVQWLGWSGGRWEPPEELQSDWLGEAVRAAARMSA